MQQVTIIASSLSETSKSQALAALLETRLAQAGVPCRRFDLRTLELPLAGPADSWGSADASALAAAVESSSHIVFAVPVYCYGVNAAAKNVIDLIGRSFTGKVVGFICSAGGAGSYMSVVGFANQLMLDFRSVIVPRFLYVEPAGWDEDGTLKPEMRQRLDLLVSDLRQIRLEPAGES